jgi:myo-inositol 2-dehydrogenase/D-chiro-inositol 1-dehydrogenase/scyllo-inositol 2-dehydrogenase (NAD+)
MASRIRVVLIGAGRAGRVHANSLTQHVPGGDLVGLVDSVTETLRETGRMYGIDEAAQFTTLEAALDKLACDAVVITTPTFTHKDLAVQALSAGKHVLCEKPMALNLAECDAMIQAAERGGAFLQIGFMRRFSPEFTAAAERIFAGEIGQPMMVKSLTHGPGLPPPWARDLKTSNGMLAEVNSHDLDCTRWLMQSNPDRVYVEVANFKGPSRGVDTPNFYDNVLTSIRFENGSLGSISGICPCDYGYDARVEIVGERGIMQIGEMQGQPIVVCTNRDQGLITPIYRTWPDRFAWGYIREMEHFIQSILAGTPPKVGGLDGRWAVAGVLAGTRSFLEARPVHVAEVLKEAV